MKFVYLIALLAFIQLVACDSYIFQFNNHKAALQCMDKNSAYINKVTNVNQIYGPVLYMNLKNTCATSEESIGSNINAVCGSVKAQKCYQG
ncbi:unnamed protein product [Cunninghamella blakesleeana]